MSDPIAIIVYSDVICPWCYLGKRRLESALGASSMPQVRLSWRPFELNPDMPVEGMARKDYRAAKFGEARSADLDRKMIETGREAGIAFAFERMQRTPNTRLAHRLIWEAGRQGRQDAVVERLFRAYFEEARDIGSADVLSEIAADSGLAAEGVKGALTGSESLEVVMRLEQQGYGMGIQGVPHFILLHRYQVSGAQPSEFWRNALPKLAEEVASVPATT